MTRNQVLVYGKEVGESIINNRETKRSTPFMPWGLASLSDKGSYTPGYPIYIGAYPGSGKTELILEMQMQLSELYGKKHIVFVGEMGGPESIYELLYWKYGGKPIRKYDRGNNVIDHQTVDQAKETIRFVNEHFLVIDPVALPKSFTFDRMIDEIEKATSIGEFRLLDYDTISIDSFYELEMEGGTGIHVQLQKLLTSINNWCELNTKTIFISTHIAQTRNWLKLPNGTMYKDRPSMYDWTGGQLWSRRGSQVWNLYLPHEDYAYFMDEDNNEVKPLPYTAWVQVEKVKFSEMGKKGDVEIFWDKKKSRYYELIDGNRMYSRDFAMDNAITVEVNNAIEPNQHWADTDKLPY